MTAEFYNLLLENVTDPIVLVDVGAAGGAIEGWKQLGDKAQIFCFEARDEESAQLSSANDKTNIEYIPFALAEDDKGIDLTVTALPTCSSSYPPIKNFYERYPSGALMRPVQTVACSSIALDSFMEQRGIERIHGIKLDTQGGELNILKGSRKALEKCLFVIVEVEFNALYEGQPLFCDVDRFMRDEGFVLWRLNNLAHYSNGVIAGDQHPMMIGSDPGGHHMVHFANGQLFWGDALYVKAAATPLSDEPITREDAIAGAILVSQWRFWDLALEYIRKSGDADLLAKSRKLLGVEFAETAPDALPTSAFYTNAPGVQNGDVDWTFDLKSTPYKCLVFGPYIRLPEGKYEVTFHVAASGLDVAALAAPLLFDVAQDETRQNEVVLEGVEGVAVLRNGRVTIPFHNMTGQSKFEFRIYTENTAFDGMLSFQGVSLRRI